MQLILNSNELTYLNCNVVFDESLLQLTDDAEFILNMPSTFNADITFPSWVHHINIYGRNFNYPLTIPSSVQDLSNCFSACANFNQPVVIPNSVTNCVEMFYACSSFNQPLVIPNSVKNTYRMFASCDGFNQPVTIPNSVTNCAHMFTDSDNFNSPVTLPNNPTNCFGMFTNCTNFNHTVTMLEGLNSCFGLFSGAYNYNQRCIIPRHVYNCQYVFGNCYSYSQPVIFEGANVVNNAFINCIRFNSSVIFRGTLRNSAHTFFNCFTFNKPVLLPEGVLICDNMLYLARRFNSVVIIPETTQRIPNMFSSINGAEFNFSNGYFGPANPDAVLQKPIYLKANSIISRGAFNLFGNVYGTGSTNSNINLYISGIQNNSQFASSFRNNGAHILNIFTDDAGQNLLYNTYLLTNGGKPTWTVDADNGRVYNASMNIHIYNNWDGVIPTGDGYHLLRYYSSNGQELYYNEYIESGYSGGFPFGSEEWSNVPNGAPITGILNDIMEDKNLYYAGTSLPYVRQMYGITINELLPNTSFEIQRSRFYENSGVIINGGIVAGVSFVNASVGGICYQDAVFPSIRTTNNWSSAPNNMYYTESNRDIFIQTYSKATKFVVTYRDGNVSNGGAKFITRYNEQAPGLIHNTGINVKVGNNSNVYVDGDTLNGARANFGFVNLVYDLPNWQVWALAPVTDGINNYEAGECVRDWDSWGWAAFTVWPR